MKHKCLFAVSLLLTMCPAYADVESGPMLDTLYPLAFYHDSDDGLYIEFQTGAMPGCSKGRGGHLSRNNPNYKELYSLLLTMMTTKNFKGAVRFEKTAFEGWWQCSIEGLFVEPQ
ncbi:hypothetical protein P7M58_24190 [Vibrio parahaemolyticus]|nr:hypothetical protein [Vibrio parahaemolyticus]